MESNLNFMKMALIFLSILFFGCEKNKGNNLPGPQPLVSINSISQPEGNAGSINFSFSLTLSNAYSEVVTVTYSTTEASAKAGEDFTAVTNQSVTFQPNETQKTILVFL